MNNYRFVCNAGILAQKILKVELKLPFQWILLGIHQLLEHR